MDTDFLRALRRENTADVSGIVLNLKHKLYHDFDSRLSFPKMRLVIDLEFVGLHSLAQDVRDGKYDF